MKEIHKKYQKLSITTYKQFLLKYPIYKKYNQS